MASKQAADDIEPASPQISLPSPTAEAFPLVVDDATSGAQTRRVISDVLLLLSSFDRFPHSLSQTLLPLIEKSVENQLYFLHQNAEIIYYFFCLKSFQKRQLATV